MDEVQKEELRVQLLQDLSRLEGRMSVKEKVGTDDFFDLLTIVRELVSLK